MKLECRWDEKMKFTAHADAHQVSMDARAPLGTDSALSPKQLALVAICGCTGMDVVALLRKWKQTPKTFVIDADAPLTEGKQPAIFREVRLTFRLEGEIEPARALEAVTLSQTKYCGVTAMFSKAVPIFYQVEVNGTKTGEGQAHFDL